MDSTNQVENKLYMLGKNMRIPMYFSNLSMSLTGIAVCGYIRSKCADVSINIPHELLLVIFEYFNDGSLTSRQYHNSGIKLNTEFIYAHMRDVSTKEKHLLLLGTQYSGKSTIIKALKCITNHLKTELTDIISESEMDEHCVIIRQNSVAGIITLLKILLTSKNKQFEQLCLNNNILMIINAIEVITEYGNKQHISSYNFTSTEQLDYKEIGNAIHIVWENISFLRQIYVETNMLYPENMEYFFDNIEKIMCMQYSPTFEDVLKVSEKTIGVHTYSYLLKDITFHVKDMPGTRFDRYSWIYEFDKKYNAMIYVAALSDFNKYSLTDSTQNAMQESIELFSQLINGKWLRGKSTELILLLNKDDLFRKLLKRGVSLSECFSEWDGPEYDAKHEDSRGNDYFEYCYEKSIRFVQDQYIFCNNNSSQVIFIHITNALDIELVQKVLWDIQNILLKTNLRRGAMMI